MVKASAAALSHRRLRKRIDALVQPLAGENFVRVYIVSFLRVVALCFSLARDSAAACAVTRRLGRPSRPAPQQGGSARGCSVDLLLRAGGAVAPPAFVYVTFAAAHCGQAQRSRQSPATSAPHFLDDLVKIVMKVTLAKGQ